MRLLCVLPLLISTMSVADDFNFGSPISQCLNRNTIPYIDTNRDAAEIVNSAYKICAKEVSDWESERDVLPQEMQERQSKELRGFYIHMIDKRRAFNASKH